MLPQWHVKDPDHSAKSAGGNLHLNMHTPLIHCSQSGLTMLLSRQSVGIHQETSSHATHQVTLVHSRLSSLSHCGLILASLYKKKKTQAGNESLNILPKSLHVRKKSPHQYVQQGPKGIECWKGPTFKQRRHFIFRQFPTPQHSTFHSSRQFLCSWI